MPILSFVTPRRPAAGVRAPRFLSAVAGFVRGRSVEAPAVAVEPAEQLPELADIEAAAATFNKAADMARAGDRGKRGARKILDRLPDGRYGRWLVLRVPSSRQSADLEEIRRIFKQHGLGPVPMKQAAPSLKVELADTTDADTPEHALAVTR